MQPIESVTFWLNAFVPRNVSGMTVTLPAGPHAGKTAIDGPVRVLTDQRAFSHDPDASSSMQTRVSIGLQGPEPTVTIAHRTGWAVTCNREDGEVVCRARAGTRGMTASVLSLSPVTVQIACAARHPCPDAPPGLEEIQFRGTLVYDPDRRELAVDIFVPSFPAFEAYGAINDSVPTVLFHHAPPAGIALSPVAHRAMRRLRTTVDDREGNGRF